MENSLPSTQTNGSSRHPILLLLDVVLALLSFLWCLHTLAVLLSSMGLEPFHPVPSLILLIAAGSFSFALLWWMRKRRKPIDTTVVNADQTQAGMVQAKRLARLLVYAAALTLVLLVVLAVAIPTFAYDAIAYRLPTLAQWLDAGQISWLVTDDAVRNGYPMGQEAISAVVAAASGTTAFFGLTSLLFVVVGALSIWMLALASGVRPWLAKAAGALWILVPITILNSVSGYVDAAFASVTVALMVLVAQSTGKEPAVASSFIGMGMAAALVLSLKGTGLWFVACITLASLLRAWICRSFSWKNWLLFVALLLPGLFWMARDIIYTGNPVWPIEVSFGGQTIFAGIGSMDAVLDSAHNLPVPLAPFPEPLRILINWFQLNGPAVDFDDRLAGLGWTWPLLALPAIGLLLAHTWRNRRQVQRQDVIFLFLLTALLMLGQPMRWWSRYTIWVWAAGAMALVMLIDRWISKAQTFRATALLTLLTAITLSEAAIALFCVKGLGPVALTQFRAETFDPCAFVDLRESSSKLSWLDPRIWRLDLGSDLCRGSWKPGTDNTLLDGIVAQLTPRPRIHVLFDERHDWKELRQQWHQRGCRLLLLYRGSPVLEAARDDRSIIVEEQTAFDPLFVIRSHSVAQSSDDEGRP